MAGYIESIEMDLEEWLEKVEMVKDKMKETSKDADAVMKELGFTEKEKKQISWIF